MSGQIRIGVGGWTFEPWRGVFFPDTLKQKDELNYMSRQLRSIDINLHVAHLAASPAACPATALSEEGGRTSE